MIALYCDTHDIRDRIEDSLSASRLHPADSRDGFERLLGSASVGIAGLLQCSDEDVAWLRKTVSHGLVGPSCVVVTPLSLRRLQRLRRIESTRFHVVWAEEAGDRLGRVLAKINPWHHDPLLLLGRRLIRDHPLHPCLVRALKHVCRLSEDEDRSPPAPSVEVLARQYATVRPDTFRRYWREQMPLRCPPKRLLSWALLLWAVRQRTRAKWAAIADEAGVRRRTLERHASNLARCTLTAASREPAMVQGLFQDWVAEVSVTDQDSTTVMVATPM